MDFNRILSRAWDIVWAHPTLGGALGLETIPPVAAVFVGLVGLGLGVTLWLISTLARGGLIASVDDIEEEGSSNFTQAFNAGWLKAGRLVGIALLPGIPEAVLFGAVIVVAGTASGVEGWLGIPVQSRLVTTVGILALIMAPLALGLGALRTFANRACMLENRGIVAAYQRGLDVLLENLGAALVLFLSQLAINIGLVVALFLPGLLLSVCALLWPVFLLVHGAVAAYFSTLWTLAWREWTGRVALAPLDFG
jgi:hypothetical protein